MGSVTRKPGPAAAAFNKAMRDLGHIKTQVGWFASAKYADGTPVAYIATVMEYGWAGGGIPARPMLRPTIARESANWTVLMGKGAKKAVNGELTIKQVMTGLGLQASGDVRKTISTVQSPALKESTVKARLRRYKTKRGAGGASIRKPLVDSSLMFNSCNFNVVEDK